MKLISRYSCNIQNEYEKYLNNISKTKTFNTNELSQMIGEMIYYGYNHLVMMTNLFLKKNKHLQIKIDVDKVYRAIYFCQCEDSLKEALQINDVNFINNICFEDVRKDIIDEYRHLLKIDNCYLLYTITQQ